MKQKGNRKETERKQKLSWNRSETYLKQIWGETAVNQSARFFRRCFKALSGIWSNAVGVRFTDSYRAYKAAWQAMRSVLGLQHALLFVCRLLFSCTATKRCEKPKPQTSATHCFWRLPSGYGLKCCRAGELKVGVRRTRTPAVVGLMGYGRLMVPN